MKIKIEFGRRKTKVTCDYCREEKTLCVTKNTKFCKKCLGYEGSDRRSK